MTNEPVIGLRYRLPQDGPYRAVIVTVDDIITVPGGATVVVVGHNLLGQRFEREVYARWTP